MKKFLFLTHITPVAKRSVLRQKLIELYFRGLREQTYSGWKAVILGEEDKSEGPFEYIHLPDLPRQEKMLQVREILDSNRFQKLVEETDYIIKLDDDDLISPVLLEQISPLDFDLYYDHHHTFYDVSSGIITQQPRNWAASTCVHRKEHLLSHWDDDKSDGVGRMLYTDHSKSWLNYYQEKKVIQADSQSPVYLRVLSPTSITSGAHKKGILKFTDISMEKYIEYLKAFGAWNPATVPVFNRYTDELRASWELFSGEKQKLLPSMNDSVFKRLFTKLKGN
jgi:hypothetical protein